MTKRSRGTVLDDLPEWIVIEEILIRLPPKDVLRCRAVRKLWCSATSTDKFMLDNCLRQPSLPVINQDIPGQEGVTFIVFHDNGSDKPRMIRRPSVSSRLSKCRREGPFDSCYSSQVNHRGSLHWLTGIDMETPMDIMVFDTVTEKFRWMCSSGQLGRQVSLWEMDDKLASCSTNDASIEIWMMQDYEAEAWALKYRINLLAMKTSPQFEYISKMSLLNQRELLICCHNPLDGPDYLLHCDIDGKFLGYHEIKGGTYSVYFTNQYFQESMIPLPYSEMQEGGLDKEPSFF
ncbi:unnamed protein product [Triticum turgidum subsp. durum]|uniref:F-box associated beta-propeller type 3 domain-containing protein n=1 Tax=Triticum turgidum subsp. durum TaxID=4567 RepID=A0A9R1C413_TRITD|nr:unnamed protein product [Triticum turgidum subsp. durum]